MNVRAKTYINDLISIDSIVTVYYLKMTGGNTDGDVHNFWEFQYVDKGHYQIMVDGVRYELDEGQLIMYAPNARHYGTGEVYDAQVGIVSFESASEALKKLPCRVITLNPHLKELLSKIITDGVDMFIFAPPESGFIGLVPRSDVSPYELQQLKHRLEMFLTELCLSEENTPTRAVAFNQSNYRKLQFEKIEAFMKSNLDKSFTLEDLSSEFSVSISKLKTLFKDEAGTGPIAYFIQLKIKEAKRLICESTLNFTQISDCLGFSSVHYFSKTFKEKTGVTPSEYAKSIYKK